MTDAVVAGLGASIPYLLGAAIPLLITVFALVVTSVVGARTGGMHVGRTIGRTLAVGLGTLTFSYLLGQLIF